MLKSQEMQVGEREWFFCRAVQMSKMTWDTGSGVYFNQLIFKFHGPHWACAKLQTSN